MKLLRRQVPTRYRAVIRFSIFDPEWGGWRATNSGAFESADDYRDWLWSETRMADRLNLFSTYAAPLYQQIAERHDFRVLLQHSADLPKRWTTELEDLSAAFPALRLTPIKRFREPRLEIHDDLRGDAAVSGPVVMLRVDDDDLISTDFVDQLSPYVDESHTGWCLSLGAGMAAQYMRGRLSNFRLVHTPLIAIGQAFVGHYRRRDDRLSLPDLPSHRHAPMTMPSIIDSRQTSYVHVRHANQDSHLGDGGSDGSARAVSSKMSRLARVTDTTGLREKFPSLTGHFNDIDQRETKAQHP